MKRRRTHLPATLDALSALGAQIAAARRDLHWSAGELAGRLGVQPAVVSNIEKGAPGTAIGTVLEAAIVCGIPLFGVDAAELRSIADRTRTHLALLPQRVHQRTPDIPDDF